MRAVVGLWLAAALAFAGASAFERGVAADFRGDSQEAIKLFSQAIDDLKNDPQKLASAYFGRSRGYAKLGENDKAQADFKASLANDPSGKLEYFNAEYIRLMERERALKNEKR